LDELSDATVDFYMTFMQDLLLLFYFRQYNTK